jgi:hypothetical protein
MIARTIFKKKMQRTCHTLSAQWLKIQKREYKKCGAWFKLPKGPVKISSILGAIFQAIFIRGDFSKVSQVGIHRQMIFFFFNFIDNIDFKD